MQFLNFLSKIPVTRASEYMHSTYNMLNFLVILYYASISSFKKIKEKKKKKNKRVTSNISHV